MNKTVIFVTFSVLAALGIAATVIIILYKTDQTASFTGFVVNLLGIVTLAAGTFYGLGHIQKKVDTVQKQTNGTLSGLMESNETKSERIRELEAEIAAYRHHPRKATEHV